jgi:hypothetical protein
MVPTIVKSSISLRFLSSNLSLLITFDLCLFPGSLFLFVNYISWENCAGQPPGTHGFNQGKRSTGF